MASSALITRIRKSFILAHPRVTAALWFGACGALASTVVGALLCFASDRSLPFAIGLIALGYVSAAIAGATTGVTVLRPGITSGKAAAEHGAMVVASASFIMGFISALPFFIFEPQIAGFWLLVAPICIAIGGGIFTVPIGCLGAWALYTLRVRQESGPSGCALHGYRDTTGGAR